MASRFTKKQLIAAGVAAVLAAVGVLVPEARDVLAALLSSVTP